MKTNWQTKKLGEISDIFEDGDWIEKKDQSSDGIRLIQTGNVGNGVFKDRIGKARYISEKTFKKLKCTEILPGDCLISRLPDPVGRACIIPNTEDRMITAVDCTIIRFQKKIIKPNWFINFSLSQIYQEQIDREVGGATRQRISRKNLYQIEIPIPPLTEQQRIEKILDENFEKIEKAKENAEKNLKNSKELFESYLNNIFVRSGNDRCEKKISDICDIGAGNSAPQKKELFIGGKYPFFRTSDVGRIHIGIISDSFGYLNDKGIKGLRLFNKGTILLPKSGASTFLNHRVILGVDGYVSSHLATIKTDENILNNNYLFYFLQRIKAQDLIQDHKYPSLNLPVIGGIKISYPSLSEQKSIVAKLDKLSIETKRLEAMYRQKLTDLEELKKSILKKAFNGEL